MDKQYTYCFYAILSAVPYVYDSLLNIVVSDTSREKKYDSLYIFDVSTRKMNTTADVFRIARTTKQPGVFDTTAFYFFGKALHGVLKGKMKRLSCGFYVLLVLLYVLPNKKPNTLETLETYRLEVATYCSYCFFIV